MITAIHLAEEGAYDEAGTTLEGLKQVNYIFGSNGSGKTTISRVIEGSGNFPSCTVSWKAGNLLEPRVYNREFVQKHFDAESTIKGVYTFGTNAELVETIKALKIEADTIQADIDKTRSTLVGEDGVSGKKKDREVLEEKLVEDVWAAKKELDDLDLAFKGFNNSKEKFCRKYLEEAESNDALVRDVSELRGEASTIFSKDLIKEAILSEPDSSKIAVLEMSAILKKRIVGKEDVDITALVEKLGNSDWVQQGRKYFDLLEDQCPFCQQKTDAAFRNSLEAFFDEAYIADLEAIDDLLADYKDAADTLRSFYGSSSLVESKFIDRDGLEKDVKSLLLVLDRNIEHISAKRKEPSIITELHDTAPLLATANAHVSVANKKIAARNDIIDNYAARENELKSQIWKRLLQDTKPIYEKYKAEAKGLDKAITSLSSQLDEKRERLKIKQGEINENERKITSIKPTLDAINRLLTSFGFANFCLVESSQHGFYEVKRADGSDAKQTLSEGERSFITFLYFYHLINGSFSSSGGTNDKVVVFDDPVSSLDSDILFIVSNLIKKVIFDMRSGASAIKQVFILTHNIYFHKEVTFDSTKSDRDKARKDETFWVIRKESKRSALRQFEHNPIKSSYELLWREIRQKPPSDTAVQNVMRRILEHYFKFYGGIDPKHIIDKFDGKDRMISIALLSWVNDGSHGADDDLYVVCDPDQVARYLTVFQLIFEESGHGGHYEMMMGTDYVPLTNPNPDADGAEVNAVT